MSDSPKVDRLRSKYIWPWRRPRSAREAEQLLHSFYASCAPYISRETVGAVLPLVHVPHGTFQFSEDWERGDRRFGKSSHRVGLAWCVSPTYPHLFWLCITYDRFRLTTPYVTRGIK